MSDTEQLEALVRRHRQLASEVAELQVEMAAIKEIIDREVEPGWSLTVDGVDASKREGNRQFDYVVGVSLLTDEERAACVKTAYDPKLVREALETDGRIESAMTRKPDAKAVLKL